MEFSKEGGYYSLSELPCSEDNTEQSKVDVNFFLGGKGGGGLTIPVEYLVGTLRVSQGKKIK
jgi:hypothetical protein